jgi:hypothetical protein
LNTGEASREPEIALDEAASRRALDAIRRDALDGLLALPRVGMGVGGLLAGTRRENHLQILERIEIPCLHALGPGFVLTGEELETARELAAKAEPLEVIGIYISKTRGALEPGPADLETLAALCPNKDQILLMIRPSTIEPVRATLFVREADGGVIPRSDISMDGAHGSDVDRAGAAEPAPAPAAAPNPALQALKRTVSVSEQANAPKHETPGDTTTEGRKNPAQLVVPIPVTDLRARVDKPTDQFGLQPALQALARVVNHPEPPPNAPPLRQTILFQQHHDRESSRRAVLYTCGAMALIAAAAFAALDMLAPKPELTLNVREENGALIFRWNRNAAAAGDRGRLLVNDAGQLREFPLDRVRIEAGFFQYRRKSDQIVAKLVIGDRSARTEFFRNSASPGGPNSNSRADPGRAGNSRTN